MTDPRNAMKIVALSRKVKRLRVMQAKADKFLANPVWGDASQRAVEAVNVAKELFVALAERHTKKIEALEPQFTKKELAAHYALLYAQNRRVIR